MASTEGFSSEGFDLDQSSEDVVLELGGGVSYLNVGSKAPQAKQEQNDEPQFSPTEDASSTSAAPQPPPPSPTEKAEDLKKQGNEYFKEGSYLDAYDMYSEAIAACPGMKGDEMLRLKKDHDEAEHAKAVAIHRSMDTAHGGAVTNETTGDKQTQESTTNARAASGPKSNTETEKESDTAEKGYTMKPFEPPVHPHGDKMAIYHSNRAACLLHLERYDEALKDCDVATLMNPTYTKAWMRRSTANEKLQKIEDAFQDVKKALETDPSNTRVRKEYARIEKLEKERMEKLKAETMDKLKDLGNSILGNFGLSLDNFQATQDPSTGSYNISFNQGNQ